MCECDVFQYDVELTGPLCEFFPDFHGHLFPVREELFGVVLGDDGLEHLVAYGREDSVVIVPAQVEVDGVQVLGLGSVEDSQVQGDCLQVLGAGGRTDHLGLGPHLEEHWVLQEGHLEVHALAVDLGLQALETVED